MSDMTFDEMSRKIQDHLKERNWDNNPPRGLAISIALEAAELLEHYQWRDTPFGDTNELAEELADVLIYAFQFAQAHNIDIPQAMTNKLAKAAEKYPAEKFQNLSEQEQDAAWINAKLAYKKKGL